MANDRRVRRHDAACVIHPDGSKSNAALHEALTEGVDDRPFRLKTPAKMLAKGVPTGVLDSVLPKPNESVDGGIEPRDSGGATRFSVRGADVDTASAAPEG